MITAVLCMFVRLADLAEEFELEQPPSLDDLLSCIVNRDDVENIIFKPVSTVNHLLQNKGQYFSYYFRYVAYFCLVR